MPDVFCIIKEPWVLAEAIGMLALDPDTWVTCVFQPNSTAVFHVEGKDSNTTITAIVSPDMFEEFSLGNENPFSEKGGRNGEEDHQEWEEGGETGGAQRPAASRRGLRRRVAPAQFQVHLPTLYRALLCSNVFSRASPSRVTLQYTSTEELVVVSILIDDDEVEEDEEEEDDMPGMTSGNERGKWKRMGESNSKTNPMKKRRRGDDEDDEGAYDPFVERTRLSATGRRPSWNMHAETGSREGQTGKQRKPAMELRSRHPYTPYRASRELQSVLQTCPVPSTLLNLRFDDALLEGEALLDAKVFHDTIGDFTQAGCKEVTIECFPFSFALPFASSTGLEKEQDAKGGERGRGFDATGMRTSELYSDASLSLLGDLQLSGKSVNMEIIEVLRGEKVRDGEEGAGEEESSEGGDGPTRDGYAYGKRGTRDHTLPPLPPLLPTTASISLPFRRRSIKATFSTLHLALAAGSGGMNHINAGNPWSFSNRVHVRVNSIGQLSVIYTRYGRGKGEEQEEMPFTPPTITDTTTDMPIVTVSFVVMPRVNFDDW